MGMYDVKNDSFVISKEMDERLTDAMRRTWNAIGPDIMAYDEEMDEETDPEGVL